MGARSGFAGSATWRATRYTSLAVGLRGDVGISLNVSNVSAWADQSPSGNSVAQGTGAAQPAFGATALNGRPAVTFVSANSQQLTKSSTNPFGVGPSTIFFVWNWASLSAATHVALATSDVSFNNGFWCSAATNVRAFMPVGGTQSSGGTITAGTSEIVCYSQAAGNNADIYVNGTQTATAGASTMVNPGAGAMLEIGGIPGGFCDVTVAEIIGFNRQLSATEREMVTKYLGARYGIAVT